MLTEICQYLKNWFDRDQKKYYGKFVILDGDIQSYTEGDMGLIEGQYFRIIGSLLNDGVHQKSSSDVLVDETFDGAVWSMAVPPAILSLSREIKEWQAKNGGASSQAMSPYNSESFGGYSYSKSSGGSTESGGGAGGWQSAYANRLKPWRKIT